MDDLGGGFDARLGFLQRGRELLPLLWAKVCKVCFQSFVDVLDILCLYLLYMGNKILVLTHTQVYV